MINKDDIYQVAVCTTNAKGFPIVDEFYSKFFSTKTSAQNYFDSLIDKYFLLLEDETDYNNNNIDECKKTECSHQMDFYLTSTIMEKF